MIDMNVEDLLTFSQAASSLPRRRGGKKPHVATLYRWAKSGLKGIQLETIQVGGTLCTSRQALQRFFDALTTPEHLAPQRSPARKHLAQIERAERLCSEAGV